MMMPLALYLLLLLVALGRFLPGPPAWGFNHLAYLPVWFVLPWLLAVALIIRPKTQARLADALREAIPRRLFAGSGAVILLAFLAAGLFALLRERSFFMGDGYLIGELQDRGVKFRTFDALDFLLHFQAYQLCKKIWSTLSTFTVYRVASVVAGTVAVVVHWILIRRLSWEPWRRTSAYLLLFLIGPVALYYGYVESYSFLFLFMSAFLISGLLVIEGRAPLWLASILWGLGLSFHVTAVATGPALLYLALKAPVRPTVRRWLYAAGPPAALFALALALHLAEGFNAFWFRKDFIESKNAHSLWIPWAQGRGLFSAYLWKDQFNLLLITAPASLVVLVTQFRRLRERMGESRIRFLLVQIIPIAVLSIVLDRKLGGARDWDLLAAHSAGLVLLSALLLPGIPAPERKEPERARKQKTAREKKAVAQAPPAGTLPHPVVALVLGSALLCSLPWLLLLHLEPRSIDRFVSVAADFPAFPRAYAYEEVGKYYRNASQMDKAQEMYERCVQAYPANARFHILLGSIYFMRENTAKAEEEYTTALGMDPNNYMAIEMLGKVAVGKKDWKTAVGLFQRLVEVRGQSTNSWELLGYAAAQANMPDEVIRGLSKAMQLDPKLNYWHDLGMALRRQNRNAEAIQALRQAVARDNATTSRTALGWALLAGFQAEVQQGRAGSSTDLDEVISLAKSALGETGNGAPDAIELLKAAQALRDRMRR